MAIAVLFEKILDARAVRKLRLSFSHADDLFESAKKQNAHSHAAILAPAAITRANFLAAHRVWPRSHLISRFRTGDGAILGMRFHLERGVD
jgi:hypothetical protein